ncbi:hypothetical protein SAY86_010639 [Trapa natans]|nr:hypothetical protein SAY86_010639 [Trapa natans]
MGSVCAEQHKLHYLLSPRSKAVAGCLDIPPRKLLSLRNAAASSPEADMFLDSPRGFDKFLPYNSSLGSDDSDDSELDSDPYSSDHFRMYDFKVRRCTRSRSHDWTDCPFAHPGEKARRRDPRRFVYCGTVCSEYRRGSCSRGDNCDFAHGVFECWLHPSRYRTEACKDGKNCKRKVCFFAHSQRELRILPLQPDNSPVDPTDRGGGKYQSSGGHPLMSGGATCCLFCRQPSAANTSPTSTLVRFSGHLSSPPISPSGSLSPPLSPMSKHRSSLGGPSTLSRYAERPSDSSPGYNKDLLMSEIMSTLDCMKVSDEVAHGPSRNRRNVTSTPWLDMSFLGDEHSTQFILSPAAGSPPSIPRNPFAFPDDGSSELFDNHKLVNNNSNAGHGLGAASSDPDLGWVNDLLM